MPTSESCAKKQTFCELGQQTVGSSPLAFNYNPSKLSGNYITANVWNNIINKIVEIYNYGARGSRNPGINMGTWKKNDTGWWFEYINGSYPTNSWIYEAGTYWHFDNRGYYDRKQTTLPGPSDGSVTYILGPFSLDLIQPTDNSSGNETYSSSYVADANRNTKYQNTGTKMLLNTYNEVLSTLSLTQLNTTNDLRITEAQFNAIKNAINNITFCADRCNNCNVKCNQNCEASSQGGSGFDCQGTCVTCYGCSGEGSCGQCFR